jgi:hypothetical protein
MHAFDRTSGKATYVRNVGGCAIVGLTDETSPAVVVKLGPEGRPSTFARVPNAPPARRVRVSGSVRFECDPRAGARVWIGDTPTTTDATGRFEATIETRGLVRIEVSLQGERLAGDGRVFPGTAGEVRDVPPDTGGDVHADLDLRMSTECGGSYMPIPCRPVRTACPR